MTPDEWLADFEAKTAELRRHAVAFRTRKFERTSKSILFGCLLWTMIRSAGTGP